MLLSGCTQTPVSSSSAEQPQLSSSSSEQSPSQTGGKPVKIKDIKFIGEANFVLTEDGDLYSWGHNVYGVLGLGIEDEDPDPLKTVFVKTPTRVPIDEPIAKITAYTNAYVVMAVGESGKLYAWGSNVYKVISGDDNGGKYYYSKPVEVDYGIKVKDIEISNDLATIIGENGKLYIAGRQPETEILYEKEIEAFMGSDHTPKEIDLGEDIVVKQFQATNLYSAFLSDKGDIFIQGWLVERRNTNFDFIDKIVFPEPIVKMGAMYQGIVGLSETGKLYFVGEDRFGIVDKKLEFSIYEKPVLIDKLEGVRDISVSDVSIIAETEDGKLLTWGYNLGRNAGDSDEDTIFTPTQVDYSGKLKYYHCGYRTNAIVTESDEIYVWGDNGINTHLDTSIKKKFQLTKIDLSPYINQK